MNTDNVDNNDDVKTIGERLKLERVKLKLSQEKLAHRAGVTQSLISQIEKGTNQGSQYLNAIARALGVSADWLETGREPRYVAAPMSMALHYPHAISDVMALIRDPEGRANVYWLVLQDEHGTQVTLRLGDTAVGSLRQKLAQLGR